MPDEPAPPLKPPTPRELLAQAERLKSQALCVSTTRLIQESRHLRESHERREKEVEKLAPGQEPPGKGNPNRPRDQSR